MRIIKTFAMVIALSIASYCNAMALTADCEVVVNARLLQIASDCITDSLTDFSKSELISHDYPIRVRWSSDTLFDISTYDLRCDFVCRHNTVFLSRTESGREIETFSTPAAVNQSKCYNSSIQPFGGVAWEGEGKSKHHVTNSIIITTEGDTLSAIMNRNTFISRCNTMIDSVAVVQFRVNDLRAYYIDKTNLPFAIVGITTRYNNGGRAIGRTTFAIDNIFSCEAKSRAISNDALTRLVLFAPINTFDFSSKKDSHTSNNPKLIDFYVSLFNNAIHITLPKNLYKSNLNESFTVIISDIRGIVWYTDFFNDQITISTSSLPHGEYQIVVSNGETHFTRNLTL